MRRAWGGILQAIGFGDCNRRKIQESVAWYVPQRQYYIPRQVAKENTFLIEAKRRISIHSMLESLKVPTAQAHLNLGLGHLAALVKRGIMVGQMHFGDPAGFLDLI
jgi:hypothetical protein